MRRKFARSLRKWADLVDPRIAPCDVVAIRVETLSRLESLMASMLDAQKKLGAKAVKRKKARVAPKS